mgnify:CR=1 FL=1
MHLFLLWLALFAYTPLTPMQLCVAVCGCRSLLSISTKAQAALLHPVSPIYNRLTGTLVDWADRTALRLRIYRPDGTFLTICWWVLKPLLIPERPPEAILQTMTDLQQRGPWRCTLTVAEPQKPTIRQPLCVAGVSHSRDAATDGPNNMHRRGTVTYLVPNV